MECRGCGKPIVFATNPISKKKIPLEKVTTYEVEWVDTNDGTHLVAHKNERDIYISHFLTCKKANDFSGSKQASFL